MTLFRGQRYLTMTEALQSVQAQALRNLIYIVWLVGLYCLSAGCLLQVFKKDDFMQSRPLFHNHSSPMGHFQLGI